MSVFTNPSSSSKEQGAAYTAAILGLVGDREPFALLRATPAALRAAVAGMDGAALRTPEAPGKWAAIQVLRHLADSEIVFAFRVRMMLAHDRPNVIAYDQDAWASAMRYGDADAAEALDEFETLRRGNLRLIHDAPPEVLARTQQHPERGEESIAHTVRMYAGHDTLHLAQVARIRKAIGR